MKTGITGATGQLGRLVVKHLKTKVSPDTIAALVRTPGKAADLGVEVRAFDYNKTESLAEALEGLDQLLLISGNEIGQRAAQHQNVINAAQQAGVKRIIYTSLLHADTSSLSLAPEHLATETAVKASGIPFTILRNGWYTENYTASLSRALRAGALTGSAGEGKISSASRENFAEAAAIVISTPGHEGKIYELAGDESYTLSDLAAEVSRQTGQAIPYRNLPEEEYADVLTGLGLPEGLARALAGFDTGASRNDLFDDSRQLSRLLGHPATPLSESVKAALLA